MTIRIVIPVRSLGEGKSRLSPALTRSVRATLAKTMFCHVMTVAETFGPTWVVSRDPALLALSSRSVQEKGHGLNPALEQAVAEIGGNDPILVLSADLPLLVLDDLAAMAALLDFADVIAAQDRAGSGTNALLLAKPGLVPYYFGENSLDAHRAAAQTRGLRFAICDQTGLSTDIDRPEDLQLLPLGLLSPAPTSG